MHVKFGVKHSAYSTLSRRILSSPTERVALSLLWGGKPQNRPPSNFNIYRQSCLVITLLHGQPIHNVDGRYEQKLEIQFSAVLCQADAIYSLRAHES